MSFALAEQATQLAKARDTDIPRNFSQGNDDKITLMHAGMRHDQVFLLDLLFPIEQQIQVQNTRTPFFTLAGTPLHILIFTSSW